jgi:PadR family transcriptional regulator, regulatory protein PadR
MDENVITYLENIKSQMRKGTLEFLVLLIVSKGDIYALDIIKKLKEVDMIVVEGTLYPLLSRLKREEVLEYNWQESTGGPPRKYYSLTEKGETILKELKQYWKHTHLSITNLSH